MGWWALAATPLFFSSNIIIGRMGNSLDPFTLATLRWGGSALVLVWMIRSQWPLARKLLARQWKLLLICGFLGMWVCGAIVYMALKYTSATNGILIYTTSPLIVLLLEAVLWGRQIRLREIAGMIAAALGVAAIITNGDLIALLEMRFNLGDLLFIVAATSWAVYSIILKSNALSQAPTRVVFALTAVFGALTLIPFAVLEVFLTANYPKTPGDWQMVASTIIFSSLLPYSLFQFGHRIHGPTQANIFMYLILPYGLGLAWILLGETPDLIAGLGSCLVLSGIIIATMPQSQPARRLD